MDDLNSKLKTFLQQSWVIALGLIGGLASIIALPLSIYLSNTSPNLTFQYSADDQIYLISNEINSGLHIFHDSIEGEIQEKLSAIKIKIWNAGKKEILRSDIRENISLVSLDSLKILEAKVIRKTTPHTEINLDLHDKLSGIIGLDFDVIEINEGIEIQLIYIGEIDKNIVMDGKIINQNGFSNYRYELPGRPFIEIILYISLIVCMISLILYLVFKIFEKKLREKNRAKIEIIEKIIRYSWITILVMFSYMIIWNLLSENILTPF